MIPTRLRPTVRRTRQLAGEVKELRRELLVVANSGLEMKVLLANRQRARRAVQKSIERVGAVAGETGDE